jgi:peptidoglycan/xylan/chitin deacetylase (PgdA/CDA1 family)
MKWVENTNWIASQLLERAALLRGALTVFMYHRVCDEGDHGFLQEGGVPFVSPTVFRDQMDFIAERGFRIFSWGEALERLEERRPFPPRSALITFDDGFRDNLTEAAPVLAEHGFTATIFVATRVLEQRELLWEHRVFLALEKLGPEVFAELAVGVIPLGRRRPGPWVVRDRRIHDVGSRRRFGERLGRAIEAEGIDEAALAGKLYLAPEDLGTLVNMGIEIGSHGAEHQHWAAMTRAEKEADLAEGDEVLRDVVGDRLLPVFSSPYGSHRREDRALLAERGYRAATSVRFGTNSHRTDRYFLRRVSLGDLSWKRLRFLDAHADIAARFDGGR